MIEGRILRTSSYPRLRFRWRRGSLRFGVFAGKRVGDDLVLAAARLELPQALVEQVAHALVATGAFPALICYGGQCMEGGQPSLTAKPQCRLLANNGLPGHVACTSALPLTADIPAPMSALAPISAASPPGADLPDGVAEGPLVTLSGSRRSQCVRH